MHFLQINNLEIYGVSDHEIFFKSEVQLYSHGAKLFLECKIQFLSKYKDICIKIMDFDEIIDFCDLFKNFCS